MKFTTFILLCIIVCISPVTSKLVKKRALARPRFEKDVDNLLKKMAAQNGYKSKFDRCHIVPWGFLSDFVDKNFRVNNNKINDLIDDIGSQHSDAAYIGNLDSTTRSGLKNLCDSYVKKAKRALGSSNSKLVKKWLFSMPCNLYPGDSSINRSIQSNLDPPKKGRTGNKKTRTSEATDEAKNLYTKYNSDGLNAVISQSKKPQTWVKSSDKPPKETMTGLYIRLF